MIEISRNTSLDPGLVVLSWWLFREVQEYLTAHPEFFATPAGLVATSTVCLVVLRLLAARCAPRSP